MGDPAPPAPETRFTVRLADGSAFGPADAALLAQWTREGRVPAGALIEASNGAPAVPAGNHPALRGFFAAPPTMAGAVVPPSQAGDAFGGLIPYRNGMALAAYYTGVFSLIPILGLLLGPAAIVLGALGLHHAKHHEHAKGRVHAWVGIGLGALVVLGHGALIAMALFG